MMFVPMLAPYISLSLQGFQNFPSKVPLASPKLDFFYIPAQVGTLVFSNHFRDLDLIQLSNSTLRIVIELCRLQDSDFT